MPISLPNFLGANTQQSVLGDLLGEAMAGYKASRMPAEQRMKEQQQQELIQQLQHGNYASGLKNQYLPGKLENEEALRELNLRYAEPKAQAELSKALLGNEAQEMKNHLMREYGVSEKEAEIYLKRMQGEHAKAQSKYGHLSHLTQNERTAARVLGGFDQLNTPQGRQLVADLEGIPPESYAQGEQGKERAPLPEGAIPMLGWPAQAKNAEIAEQRKVQTQINSWKEIYSELDKADQILTNNPKIGESAAAIIENANPDQKGYMKPILKNYTNQADRSAVEKLDKIYSNVALKLEAAMPGRGSVFKLGMIQKAKGRSANTAETNRFINEGLREEGRPYLNFEPKLKAVRGRYSLPFYIEDNVGAEGGQNPIETAMQNHQGVAGDLRLRPEMYTKENIEYTAKENGMTPQEVADILGVPYAG